MTNSIYKTNKSKSPRLAIGLDLGDRLTHFAIVQSGGKVKEKGKIKTNPKSFEEFFSKVPKEILVILEAGTPSLWVADLLKKLEFEFLVVDPNQAGRAIATQGRKSDDLDAKLLAQIGLSTPDLLRPIVHREIEAHCDLEVVRVRKSVIDMRTKSILTVRSMLKSFGIRVPSNVRAETFHKKAKDCIPEMLKPALFPLLETIERFTQQIREFDKKIEALGEEKYPETKLLRAISGVGPLVALAFVLTIHDPYRFRRSRLVGSYFGLVPRQFDSGESSPNLGITKAGDREIRRLLLMSAHYILGPFGDDCDLRRHGMKIMSRGGPNAKKKALVAVARKLAVLMHHLWVHNKSYNPFYSQAQKGVA